MKKAGTDCAGIGSMDGTGPIRVRQASRAGAGPHAACPGGNARACPSSAAPARARGASGDQPLDGGAYGAEKETLRPIAVMFNNLKGAQPQVGISAGGHDCYEMEAEGGITRMLGLFQSLDGMDTLGSIRSTRAYYLELALGHDALLVHAGGSPEAYRDIPVWKVDNMDGVNGGYDAQIFWRDKERRKTMGYEHTLVTSGEKIQAYVDGHFRAAHPEGYAHPLVFAADGTPKDGVAAEHLTLRFSPYKTGTFDYDAEKKAYIGRPVRQGAYRRRQWGAGQRRQRTGAGNGYLPDSGRQGPADEGPSDRERKGDLLLRWESGRIRWSKADRNSPFPLCYAGWIALDSGGRGVGTSASSILTEARSP